MKIRPQGSAPGRVKIEDKSAGLRPAPRKLFEKSLTKNFKIKTARMRGFVKVLMKLFQKFPGCGAEPCALIFNLHPTWGGALRS